MPYFRPYWFYNIIYYYRVYTPSDMEIRGEWKGPYFGRIGGEELKTARKAAKVCSTVIDKIRQIIGKDIGSASFDYKGHLIECSLGKQFDYYHGRILTATETMLGNPGWRKVTILHDNQKDFPFTQYEENLYRDRPQITNEVNEESQFDLERKLKEFSGEIDQWKPIIS